VRVSILGLGDILEGDNGVGCHIVEKLSQKPLTDSVQLSYVGRDPRYAGGYLYGADLAIVVGALELGNDLGKIHRWSYPTFQCHAGWLAWEYSWVGYLVEAFSRADLASGLPKETLFLWIEPAVTDGFVLSDTVCRSMWRTVQLITHKLIHIGCCANTASKCLNFPCNPTQDSGCDHYGRNPLPGHSAQWYEPA
jgi:hydrogenase maturation protease